MLRRISDKRVLLLAQAQVPLGIEHSGEMMSQPVIIAFISGIMAHSITHKHQTAQNEIKIKAT